MLQLTENKVTSRDEHGNVRHIEHVAEPFLSPALDEISPEQLADAYVAEAAGVYGMPGSLLADLSAPMPEAAITEASRLHRERTKEVAGSVVVNYTQTYAGLPVWHADFSVHIAPEPMRVTSSTSSLHDNITLGNDPKAVAAGYEALVNAPSLGRMLGLRADQNVTKINGTRLFVYEYDAFQRLEAAPSAEERAVSFEQGPPMPALPPVPPSIVGGMHYAVVEVLFDMDLAGWTDVHWRAMVEPLAGAVLYLRALIASATAAVFKMDPISRSGDPALIPAAAEAALAGWSSTVALTDLVAANPQDLRGARVDLREIENPVVAEPTRPAPGNFIYPVKTTDFTAANAYYHVNWFFNLIRNMGFNLDSYFDGTTFPVAVDHWSLGGAATVNAHCPGNAAGNGIGHFCFAAAQAGQNVGIADDIRVVIHEFGHALLWDQVGSPNFGFAHSAGDAIGAILMDPESRAPDRFLTFPWPQTGAGPLDRRHDRAVADGWAWFGSLWNTQYGGEQVLSTTLFRLYRAVGGDSPYKADRVWAARYVCYLIIKAIGTLTSTTPNPEVFATALMNADLTTTSFEGQPGGALHKVIRWAFEKQGLYQAAAHPGTTTPVTAEGNPPPVDVYIDDGRHGQYPYLLGFWNCQDMWVRRNPDGGLTHQNPAVGKTNYLYVRVKNRGLQTAGGVAVKAYHCNPGTGLAWPTHWSPMTTPFLAGAPIPSGGQIVVGPFAWKPETYGHECLIAIASANGDRANDTTVMSPIAHSRFVPFDNNIGQRNVHPVFVLDWKKFLSKLQNLPLHVVNPFDREVKVEMVAVLPKSFTDKKYWLFFNNAGGNKFVLGPKENRKVTFSVVDRPAIPKRHPWTAEGVRPKPGIPTAEEMLGEDGRSELGEDVRFQVITLIDGQLAGGMTYVVKQGREPGLTGETTVEVEEEETVAQPADLEKLLETMRKQPGVKSVRLKNVNFEISYEE